MKTIYTDHVSVYWDNGEIETEENKTYASETISTLETTVAEAPSALAQLRSSYLCVVLGRKGDRGSTVVKVLCYKSEGRWFDPS